MMMAYPKVQADGNQINNSYYENVEEAMRQILEYLLKLRMEPGNAGTSHKAVGVAGAKANLNVQ